VNDVTIGDVIANFKQKITSFFQWCHKQMKH